MNYDILKSQIDECSSTKNSNPTYAKILIELKTDLIRAGIDETQFDKITDYLNSQMRELVKIKNSCRLAKIRRNNIYDTNSAYCDYYNALVYPRYKHYLEQAPSGMSYDLLKVIYNEIKPKNISELYREYFRTCHFVKAVNIYDVEYFWHVNVKS